jgi:amino acid adenylation domain-containing protein
MTSLDGCHMDWVNWHKQYDVTPRLQARLKIVCKQIGATLDECPASPIKIISVCAGDGRDLINALQNHKRRSDVAAALLDNNPETIARGQQAAAQAGLERQLRFVQADAALASSYLGLGHADLVILSGMLTHLRHEDVSHLIRSLPMLCKSGGWVIWNRHLVLHDGKEQLPIIRKLFQRTGFEEVYFEITDRKGFAVGRARFAGQMSPLNPTQVFFEFVGLDRLSSSEANNQRGRGQTPDKQKAKTSGQGFAASLDAEQSIPACFERIAGLHGARVAISSGAWEPVYSELNAAANVLARALVSRGGAPGDRVAILMRHDGPQIAAVLAALKAGRVVVVLNPTDPPARLKQVLDDAEPGFIVTDLSNRALAGEIAGANRVVVSFGENSSGADGDSNFKIAPGDPAFLVYTSGSTGRPKGVVQTHRNILHNALRLTRGMKLRAEDRIILLASLSGAQGVATMWCALLNGAALCPFPAMEKGVTGLAGWMVAQEISVYVSSASLFRHFMRTLNDSEQLSKVRLVRLGAESSTSEDFAAFQRHFPGDCVLFHTLSSSETGFITQLSLTRGDRVSEGRLPVGRAAEGVEILLLDDEGREVRAGETGEIVVKSRYLSPGYWCNEALTAQKFSETGKEGVGIFHSGDLGRRNADGLLMHMGRKDAQVKIRGYRIELSEIEDALIRLPQVEKAIVSARTTPNEDAQLLAYVIRRDGRACTAETLRHALRAALPGYMTPAGFVFLEQFPLTPHGKIDREALRKIDPQILAPASSDHHETETETLLAGIWKQVFGRDAIAQSDNFFDLGGDSLSAAVVAARVYSALEVELPLRAFADPPTLAELSGVIDELRRSGRAPVTPKLVRVPRDAPFPLSFEQEHTWRHARKGKEADGYTVATCYRLRGPLEAGVLRECMNYLVQRHEMLRTTFDEVAGKPVQIIHPAGPVAWRQFDFNGAPDAEEKARRILQDDARQAFDLTRGPLIRFSLVKIRDDEHRLLSVTHHIILDAWSWKIFLRELGVLYEAKLRGEAPPLPEFEPLQYGDYAVWQRQVLRPDQPAFRVAVEWWREQSLRRASDWRGKCFSAGPRATRLPLRRFWKRHDAAPVEGLIWWGIDPATSRQLDQIGREARATYYITRLAVFAALVAAESGGADVILGTYVTNRTRIELQNMFGFFANPAALRLRCDLQRTFREWLAEVRKVMIETQAHAEIPYDKLCQELRKAGVKPLKFDLIFGVSDHTAPVRFGGVELTWLERRMEAMPSGFTLTFDQHNENHRCWAAFDARIYDPTRVRDFISRLARFLSAVSRKPDSSVTDLIAMSKGSV